MLVVADTSPIRYLIVLGEIHLLPLIFRQVLIPAAVLRELTSKSTSEPVRIVVEGRPEWLDIRDPDPQLLIADFRLV